MTDLTNKDVGEANALIEKYRQLLEVADIKKNEDVPILAIMFDVGITYINENHKDIPVDWKAWSMVATKNWYFSGKIKTSEDVYEVIDSFIDFWKSDYSAYCDDIIAVNDYERDRGFIQKFFKTKKR